MSDMKASHDLKALQTRKRAAESDVSLDRDVVSMIDEFGSGKIPCQGGRLVVKDRVVVTVETA